MSYINYKKDPLPELLKKSIAGKLDEVEAAYKVLAKEYPNNNRVSFNRGWYELRRGRLKEGFRLIDKGREEGIFGNKCTSSTPLYLGQELNGEVVMLILEGGFGDQIHSARWVRSIKKRGGRVVVACSPQLAEIFMQIDGVDAIVDSRAVGAVYHQYHIMGMSGYLSFEEVDSTPYIPCKKEKTNGEVGIRWSGNPQFEHQQHRTFDPRPLFELPVNLVSLQRDSDLSIVPKRVRQPTLTTWLDTQKVIEQLDLVITSCTSVAHLSAAMGKETWIIVPVLPYYLWADGKEDSIWYKNVKLFRQVTYGNWELPLNSIKERITDRYSDE